VLSAQATYPVVTANALVADSFPTIFPAPGNDSHALTLAGVNKITRPPRQAAVTGVPNETPRRENRAMTIRKHSTSTTVAWRTALAGSMALATLLVPAVLPAAQAKSPTPPVTVAKVASPEIRIENFQFTPATVTVPVGTTVNWANNDGTLHTVTSTTKVFSSAGLDDGGVFSYTFTSPGTYSYFCKLHPHMTGTIVVK
jgi:plastocyanin